MLPEVVGETRVTGIEEESPAAFSALHPLFPLGLGNYWSENFRKPLTPGIVGSYVHDIKEACFQRMSKTTVKSILR